MPTCRCHSLTKINGQYIAAPIYHMTPIKVLVHIPRVFPLLLFSCHSKWSVDICHHFGLSLKKQKKKDLSHVFFLKSPNQIKLEGKKTGSACDPNAHSAPTIKSVENIVDMSDNNNIKRVCVCVWLAHVFFIEVKLATRCVSSRTSRYKWAYNAHTPRRPRKHSGLERAQTVAEHLPAFMAHIIIMSTLTMGQGPEYTHMSRKCTLTNVEAACQTWKHICLPAGGLINKPECLCVCVCHSVWQCAWMCLALCCVAV